MKSVCLVYIEDWCGQMYDMLDIVIPFVIIPL
jgi:hypothetical protein